MLYSVYSGDKINDFKITLNGVEIKRVKSCKYDDDELKFDIHIDYIYNKLIRYVGIFYKLAHKLPYFCRRNIYYAFVNSHVAYGIEIYANTSKTLLHKLHILNNKLLRILQQQEEEEEILFAIATRHQFHNTIQGIMHGRLPERLSYRAKGVSLRTMPV